MATEITREDIDRYLTSRRCVLWGRAFDINSADGRAAAVEFLFRVIAEITECRETQ